VFVQEPPEPGEDDGKQIAALTLDEIAREIAETYSEEQVARFLYESGIPAANLQIEAKSGREYLVAVFLGLLTGGSASRRGLRTFIGQWLSDLLPTGPRADVRRRIITQLARQGWRVRDGRLCIGPREVVDEPATSNAGEAQFAALHLRVRSATGRYLASQHLEVAAFEAMKAVTNRVKAMTGSDKDGAALMAEALADHHPLIEVADRSTETGRSIQAGYRFLFMGAVQAIRNPDAHEPLQSLSPEEAMERLALASLLMRVLDGAASVSGTQA